MQAPTVTNLSVDFPYAVQATKIVRHRTSVTTGKRSRETVYVITDPTSRQASPHQSEREVPYRDVQPAPHLADLLSGHH
ncbi:hypothetical protein [Streptomyces shenzhenensis]|uniref:hypothetical protein n=1 Tax=Streptomyces shenzhenensis TaxID=943815 RepID=UPI001F1F8677|nr:hypothetical protein [Streptomyces shenzhenensis]